MIEISAQDRYLLKNVVILSLFAFGIAAMFYYCGLDERFYISAVFFGIILLMAVAEKLSRRDI